MKASYVKGSSVPSRPRVMAVCSRGHAVSVGRGTCRPAIELRNHPFGMPTAYDGREGNTMCSDNASCVIGPAESKTLSMYGSSMHENREIPATSCGEEIALSSDRSGKACGHNPDVYVDGKSHIGIVPVNAWNKAGEVESANYGGNENPSRNRKSGTGNPSPNVELVLLHVRLRTRGRKG